VTDRWFEPLILRQVTDGIEDPGEVVYELVTGPLAFTASASDENICAGCGRTAPEHIVFPECPGQ
jgi:hypothetical protein